MIGSSTRFGSGSRVDIVTRTTLTLAAALICALSSCKTLSSDRSYSRFSAWDLAEEVAKDEGIRLRSFKHRKGTFLTDQGYWCMEFEQRGMLLALGEHFVVFINDRSGETHLVHNLSYRNVGSEQRLANEIENLKK